MSQIEEAHHELDRLQGIITRHEGFIFTIRGWLILVVGGLLAGYYTQNIDIDDLSFRLALPLIAALFLAVEYRHLHLVEAAVDRIGVIEGLIAANRDAIVAGKPAEDWYGGPKVGPACQDGATRLLPRWRMTFLLNLVFYAAVVLVVFLISLGMPRKAPAPPSAAPAKAAAAIPIESAGV